MGKSTKRSSRAFSANYDNKVNEANNFHKQNFWKIIAEEEEEGGDGDEIRCDDSTFFDSDSSNSFPSSTSSDLIEDVSSSSSSSSSLSNGPLYKLSDLMVQLPIKRGLSKYYEGKSQSYASLASVESLEDLAKRENPYRNKRIKYCKSFCGGLEFDHHHHAQTLFCSPNKATISNKTPSSTSNALLFFQNNG